MGRMASELGGRITPEARIAGDAETGLGMGTDAETGGEIGVVHVEDIRRLPLVALLLVADPHNRARIQWIIRAKRGRGSLRIIDRGHVLHEDAARAAVTLPRILQPVASVQ